MPADSDTSSLVTLPGSLRESLYRIKGQRRFQALSEDYPWPCDTSAAKLELLIAAICGRDLYRNALHWEPEEGYLRRKFASSEGMARILDLGSGMTATWCVSMAEKFPQAEVVGVGTYERHPSELAYLIPCDLSYLPPNLSIEIHDLLEGLPFPDDYFDLIHFRDGGIVSFMDSLQTDMVAEMARTLKPGGVCMLEIHHNIRDPFYSKTPDNPVLALVRERNQLRVGGRHLINSHREGEHTTPLGHRVRAHEAFRKSTKTIKFEIPVGVTDENSPPEKQLGSIVRDTWLLQFEMMSVAAGLDDAFIRELSIVDQLALPVKHKGVFVRGDVVWAEKKMMAWPRREGDE